MKTKQQKFDILTTSKEKKYEQAQFEFALSCAERAINQDTSAEIKDFFYLVALMRVSENFGDIEFLKDEEHWAAYRAADQAAYRAADQAAERKVQLDVADYVWKKWGLK